ncbi:Hypothetical predicted protein, partial [Pelobates cultripes]
MRSTNIYYIYCTPSNQEANQQRSEQMILARFRIGRGPPKLKIILLPGPIPK